MIICTNCGTSNKDENNICRKCGALLPVSNKPPRIRLSGSKNVEDKLESKKRKIQHMELEHNFHSKLQKIPKNLKLDHDNEIKEEQDLIYNINVDVQEYSEEENGEILREITPKPFKGSIIASKGVYSSEIIEPLPISSKSKNIITDSSLLKQKQLEDDMTKVLKFLSQKVTVKKLPSEIKKDFKEKKEEVIPPASLNEILKELLKLDLHIEASAIIKRDGTILASAISSRISDSLFATIGQNLSMIGTDIVEGLSAGKLTNLSVRGTKGVLDLAPIDIQSSLGKEMILIILSNPRVKSGIINFAANIVKKQVKEYLGISK